MHITVFLLKRTAYLVLLSLLIAFITFWLSSMIPGDFFSAQMLDPTMQKQTIDQLRHTHGLDQPFYIQYVLWVGKLFQLDLGYSLFYQRPVSSVVASALANTLWLGIPALLVGFVSGIVIGSIHGIYNHRIPGRFLDLVSTIALSIPSLVLGLGALLFAAHSQWFPLGSMNSLAAQDQGVWQWIIDRLHHLILPVICLTIPIYAYVERIQSAATAGIGSEAYVRCARARGLGTVRLFFCYVLRPGLNPVLSVTGPIMAGVLSGSLVLEVIFSWPGLGQITYDSLFSSDLFLLAGCILGSSALLVLGNLLADIALMTIDPRTRSFIRRSIR